MLVLQKYVSKELAARAKDHFMSSNLLIIYCGQSDICKVLIIPQISKHVGRIGLKIIPAQLQSMVSHCGLISRCNKFNRNIVLY